MRECFEEPGMLLQNIFQNGVHRISQTCVDISLGPVEFEKVSEDLVNNVVV